MKEAIFAKISGKSLVKQAFNAHIFHTKLPSPIRVSFGFLDASLINESTKIHGLDKDYCGGIIFSFPWKELREA